MEKSNVRIPVALQAVFLASNRGQEVHTPPPGNVAIRVFKSLFYRNNNVTTNTQPRRGFFRRRQIRSNRDWPLKEAKVIPTSGALQLFPTKSSKNEFKLPVRDIFVCQEPTNRSGNTKSISSRSSNRSKISKARRNSIQSNLSSLPDDPSASASSVTFNEEEEFASPGRPFKDKNTPQSFLDKRLNARGYSTKRYYTLESGYYNQTTKVQRSSYNVYVIDLVKDKQIEKLRALFGAGLSTNPANNHGEGLINLVCRLGEHDILKVMIDCGCDLQVSDDYGRTPLHDACWTPNPSFKVVEQLLKVDPHMLFMMDVRGSLPLAYVQEKDYNEWLYFLMSKEDELWPVLDNTTAAEPPPLILKQPNSRPIPDPPNVPPSAVLEMLAAGRMSPSEVHFLLDSDDEDDDLSTDDDDDEGHYKSLDDFDIEGDTFCRASVGGYTFDFSESEQESMTSDSYCENEVAAELANNSYIINNTKSHSNSSDVYDIVAEFESILQPKSEEVEPSRQLPDVVTGSLLTKSKSISITPNDCLTTIEDLKTIGEQSVVVEKNNKSMNDIVVVPFHIGYRTPIKSHRSNPEITTASTVISFQDTTVQVPEQLDCCPHRDTIAIEKSGDGSDKMVSGTNIVSRENIGSRSFANKYCIPENDDGLLFGSC